MTNKYLEKIAGMLDAVKGIASRGIKDIKSNPKTYAAIGAGGAALGLVGNHNTKNRLKAEGKPMTRMNALKDQATHII